MTAKPHAWPQRCTTCETARATCEVIKSAAPDDPNARCCSSCHHHDVDLPNPKAWAARQETRRTRRDVRRMVAEADAERDAKLSQPPPELGTTKLPANPTPRDIAAAIAARRAPARRVYTTSSPSTKES